MVKSLEGSLGMASSFQLTEKMNALDKQSKSLLQHKEVIAVILKYTVEEYFDSTVSEVMDFIIGESISEEREVSRGRTNTRIAGAPTEFAELNEKTSCFDVFCKAKNPKQSSPDVQVNLHVDLESQKNYRNGYPIEKRGIYYLSRAFCAQLNLLTEQTDYGHLEKCYSIWICRDNIPKKEQMSISYYGITNFKNIGNCKPMKEDYDLLQLIIIRLGNRDYQSAQGNVLEFLTSIFYPHKPGFRQKIAKYINVESTLKLQEGSRMIGLGESIFQEGIEEGREQGIEAFILDNLEEKVPEGRILEKLQRRFRMDESKARMYLEKYMQVILSSK